MADFSNIIQEINTNLPDNNTQSITAAKLRTTLIDLTNQIDTVQDNFEAEVNQAIAEVDPVFATNQSINNVSIVNDLTTGGANNVLSAEQGKVLDRKIQQLSSVTQEYREIYQTNGFFAYIDGVYMFQTASNFAVNDLIPVEVGDIVTTNSTTTGAYTAKHLYFNENGVINPISGVIGYFVSVDGKIEITQSLWDSGVRYVSFSYNLLSLGTDTPLVIVEKQKTIQDVYEEVQEELSTFDSELKEIDNNTKPLIENLSVSYSYQFNADSESKLELVQDIVLQNDSDSLEFNIDNVDYVAENGKYSLMSRGVFSGPSIAIDKETGYLSISGNLNGVQNWIFLNDATIGNVIGKNVKISYVAGKIEIYVNDSLKKTIDNQPIIRIRSFGKTGSYGYITYNLNLFKVNNEDYDIFDNAVDVDNSNVTLKTAVEGIMTPEESETIHNISRKIIIQKVNEANFNVKVPMENGTYAIHKFVHNFHQQNLVYIDSNSVQQTKEDVVTQDVWSTSEILLNSSTNHTYRVQGNLNFIYLVKDDESGFENEDQHIGAGHGCEIMDFQKFYADGKEITPYELTEEVSCDSFRVILKAYDYAGDSTQSHPTGVTVLKLDENGDPILTAIHTYDALFSIDGTIKWSNNLLIKRNGVRFYQLHGSMLQGWYSGEIDNILVENANYDINDYSFQTSGGTTTLVIQEIGDSINLNTYRTQKSNCCMLTLNDECQVWQNMVNIDDNTNQYVAMSFYTNDPRLKVYYQPCKTEYNGTGQSKTFNDGDLIRVDVERKIILA